LGESAAAGAATGAAGLDAPSVFAAPSDFEPDSGLDPPAEPDSADAAFAIPLFL
jgi:hypothetical protein